ncbi:hypothetical protein [Streptomyces sp. WG7]|uniref:hypothetical protein n=1 Tax=Streptomyces sp. WG7 TaxID=3417650 RepID=UPI003CEE65DA
MALAVLTVLTVAACGGPDEPDAAPASPPDRPTASRSAPQSASAEPGPSVSAADGHDADACTDGNCEIAVTKPVTIHFQGPGGPATLSVTEVGPNKIEYSVKSGNGQSKGGASGPGQGCVMTLRENGSGTSCGALSHTRPSPQPDSVVMQATTTEHGSVLLRLIS